MALVHAMNTGPYCRPPERLNQRRPLADGEPTNHSTYTGDPPRGFVVTGL